MAIKRNEMEQLGGAYTLSHPARAAIVKFLRKEGPAYTTQIAKTLGVSERLASFHLSMLSSNGFLDSEYKLTNPATSPPRVARYYRLTPKVDETLQTFVDALK